MQCGYKWKDKTLAGQLRGEHKMEMNIWFPKGTKMPHNIAHTWHIRDEECGSENIIYFTDKETKSIE